MREVGNFAIILVVVALMAGGSSWQAFRRHQRGANPFFWDRK